MAATLGDLNGKWAALFKFNQVAVPILVAWATWVTANQMRDNMFRERSEVRFENHLSNGHHPVTQARMEILERNQAKILSKLDELMMETMQLKARSLPSDGS